MSSKAISKVVGITEKMVDRYIQLDTTDAIEMWAESHPFYDKAAAVAAEVKADEGVLNRSPSLRRPLNGWALLCLVGILGTLIRGGSDEEILTLNEEQ